MTRMAFESLRRRLIVWRGLLGFFAAVGLLWGGMAASTAQAQTPDERFQIASKAMADRDEAEAAYQLREVIEDGYWAHGALHNLGNAEWKVYRTGYAILAWERARSLNPFARNTIANLRFARAQAQLVLPERPWYEQYSEWLPSTAWLWGCSLGLWGGVALLTLPRLLGLRRADWHQGVAALLLAVFLLATPALLGLYTRGSIGVILEEETALRLTPTHEAETLSKLTAGELARVEDTRGEYIYVRAEGDRAGWIQKREFWKIWPDPPRSGIQ
jgi:hypothetical protein